LDGRSPERAHRLHGAGAATTGGGGGVRIPAWTANSTVALFAASILCAAWVLSGIPWIVVCLEGSPNKNIYCMKLTTFWVLGCVPLWAMAMFQHLFFAAGIVVLAVAVFYRS
jgi:hypothetical protein